MSRTDGAMARLERVVTEQWRSLPGDETRAVPTSAAGIEAMEGVLEEVAGQIAPDDFELEVQITSLAQTCAWARRPLFVGSWATPIGAAAVVAALLIAGRRTDSSALLAAAVVWTAAVPLYLRAAVAFQFEVTARLLSGDRTIEEQFLAFVAAGPPLLLPFWLTGAAVVCGMAAPALVLVEGSKRGRFIPGLVMTATAALAVVWAI